MKLALVAIVSTVLLGPPGYAVDRDAPDNAARNARDDVGDGLTAGDQSNNPDDVALTRRIRQAIVADSSLSTLAHNVKIITTNGVVTLRGPVRSLEEQAKIGAAAAQVAGANRVTNHLEITPE